MTNIDQLSADPRVAVRRSGPPDPEGRCVVYRMGRSQRATDNLALDTAIEVANLLGRPVVVFFEILPRVRNANLRHYHFLAQGLGEIADGLGKRGVGFVLRSGAGQGLARFCEQARPCLVIGDENPLRESERAKERLAGRLRVPFWTVDSDVIVPSRLLGKEHYAARTIRPRIHSQLKRFLRPIPNIKARVPWKDRWKSASLRPDTRWLQGLPLDRSVQPVDSFIGGTREGMRALRRFVRHRLKGYAKNRNHPELDGTSRLSPYLHFGHLGPHAVALAVRQADAPLEDREAFLEEMIVRRELAVNFVRFNPYYDRVEAWEPWARKTLQEHARDTRRVLYGERELEQAETADPLWNAAQKQMVLSGWMHGYLRMYWAKKILEWSRSAEEAYEIAVRLNDRYELDGRDPNGYAGIAWAICGKHDRAWGPERPVFGKIRYMSYESTSRKFDGKGYIAKIEELEKKSGQLNS